MVLSGYSELQSMADAINEGAIYRFLSKPWDDQKLLGIVFDRSLPPIHRVDLRNDVDAGRQPLFYQLCREIGGIERRADCRQHEHRSHCPAILAAA